MFSRGRTHQQVPISLKLEGQEIPKVEKATFLGVIFDEKLLWGPYIKSLLQKVRFKVQILSDLAREQQHRHPKYMLNLFRCLITPVFEYGACCYAAMSQCHWQKIKSLHGWAIRSFLKMPKFISYDSACDYAFSDKINEQLLESAKKRLAGILAKSPLRDKLLQSHDAHKTIARHPSAMQLLLPIDNP